MAALRWMSLLANRAATSPFCFTVGYTCNMSLLFLKKEGYGQLKTYFLSKHQNSNKKWVVFPLSSFVMLRARDTKMQSGF